MKRKLLFLAAFVASALGMRAQTDVTSQYLTNADFSQTTASTAEKVYGYGKDGSPYGLQDVDGWTKLVVAGDNGNVNYPNSGMAGVVVSYGSSTLLQGGGKAAPSADPDGNAGNCLGFFGVWGCGGYYYQEVTFPAGEYTINIPVYNQQGTNATTTYFGFIPNTGTSQTISTPTSTGSWVTLTKTFTLTAETAGKICVGYKSNGSGSGANPHLFIDKVQILYTAAVIKDVLETAITAATNANEVLKDNNLTAAISAAQAVYDSTTATQDEVNAAAATLNVATELAMSAAGDVTNIFLTNPGFEICTETTSNAAAGSSAAPRDIAGEWTQVSSAAWSSSAVVSYGGAGQVNGASAPSVDNADNSGKTLGVSVGWGGLVTYQSPAVTLPAGVYTLQVYGYNANTNATVFASKFGFVPTSGESTLSTKTSFASGSWEADKVTVTLNEATEGKIQVGGQAVSGGSGANAKVFFDNITITYSSFLAAAKADWDEAVANAEQAKIDCPNVTGDELTALNEELAKAEPTTVSGYEEATAAIETATATLQAAKDSYDAYAEILSVANALDVTISDEPTTAADAATATHTLNVAVYNATTAENFFNVTDVYAPSWSNMTTTSGQHWSGDTSIAYADNWSGNTETTERTATITLPAGKYVLMSAGRGSSNIVPTMSANGTTVTFATNSDAGRGIDLTGAANFAETAGTYCNDNNGRGWEWRYIPVELTEETAVTVAQTLTRLSGNSWGSFSDFRIMKVGVVATDNDYAALNAAIGNAEANTLGFENGEYAPYNNIAALTALAQAKAIDQNETNDQEDVQAVTTALSGVTWTANTEDVDAIYNGMFDSDVEGDWGLTGWTRTNTWGQQRTNVDNGEGDYLTAYYNQPGSLQYGNQGFYTMPLAANTIYKLTFAYRSHENNSNNGITVSVLNGEDGLSAVSFPGNGSTSEWKHAEAYFTTGEAGDYVLTLANSGNTWMTNVSLVKASSDVIAISETDESSPLTSDYAYANVALTRTLVGGQWNGFSVPFGFTVEGSALEGAEVKKFASVDENKITLEDATEIVAGEPYLVRPASDITDPTFEGVEICDATEVIEGTGDYTFQAHLYNTELVTDGSVAYVSTTDSKIKKLTSGSIKGLRAIFNIPTDAAAKALVVDFGDGTTGILNVDKEGNIYEGPIYNLSGQRVNMIQKGFYIVNGKKVLVK